MFFFIFEYTIEIIHMFIKNIFSKSNTNATIQGFFSKSFVTGSDVTIRSDGSI